METNEKNSLLLCRQAFLDDTIAYYSQDITRRSTSLTGLPRCMYRNLTGQKCAIGRFIDDKMYNPAIESCSVASLSHFIKLPDWLLFLGIEFLIFIQKLHDTDSNWDQQGLSTVGKSFVSEIEKNYIT